MVKRFSKSPIQAGEISSYLSNPWARYTSYPFSENGKEIEIVQVSDEFLQNRGGIQALESYTKLLYDSTVLANFIKLCQEIISRDLIIEAASQKAKDLKVCEEVKRQLGELNMDEVYRKFCEAYIYGHAPQEVMWRKSRRGVIEAYDVRPRDPRRFIFVQDSLNKGGFSMRLLTREDPYKGVEIPNRKIMSFRYWVQNNGDPYGSGLGKALYFLVKVKRRALESEVLYTDRYATPTALAIAPLSATREEVDGVYQLITNLSQETGAVLPEGWTFNFIDPAGTPDTFQNLREALHKEISFLIAGEDEAGSSDAGSRASSEVAQDVRTRKAMELSELISKTLEQTLIKWIVELNFGMGVAIPKIRRNFPMEEPSTLTATDLGTLMDKLKVKPTLSWVESHFGVELERDENGEIFVEDVEANQANSFFGPEG